ncbi:MAG: hypothetical protein J0L64_12450 [Acidobacteria bacterium]|nr:hypothetical protein [Acidobacteriota bacterium]
MTTEIALLIEYESEGDCSTATIRKGQKFVWMWASVYAYDYEGAWEAFPYQLSVKVNGIPVYSVSALTFNIETECENGTFCNREVVKVIDVSSFTHSASAQLEVLAYAVRPPGLEDPGHYGQVYTVLTVHPRSRFLLSDTRQDFRPGNSDSADPVAATCSSGYDCYPSFEARIQESCCDVKIGFELSDVSTLAGVSTNYGSGTGLDYAVDPELNQGMVSVSGPPGTVAYETAEPWTMANLMISSLDYGGKAKVKAYFLAPETGEKIYAEVVEDLEQPTEPESTMERQFARLPFDEDEDGMADGWESGVGGVLLVAANDTEPGGGAPGDGLPVFDEYRGFHVLEGTAKAHIRTHPDQEKDVFYWDASGTAIFHDALVAHLAQELPGIVYHPVDDVQAGVNNPTTKEVDYFNKNSPLGPSAYAFVYELRQLSGGSLGSAGGIGKSFKPILIDDAKIGQTVASYGFVMTHADLRALVLSHETGHRFGLTHPYRLDHPTSAIPAQRPYASVQFHEYARDLAQTNVLYNRSDIWPHPVTGSWLIADQLSDQKGILSGNKVIQFNPEPNTPPPPGSLDSALKVTMRDPVPNTSLYIYVETQELFLMDWNLRQISSMSSLSAWHFKASDIDRVVVNVVQ